MTPAATSRRRSRIERVVIVGARIGLAGRGCFYLLLAALVLNLAARGPGGPQADAHGALATVASSPGGLALVVAVAFGFVLFGVTRLCSAVRDGEASRWRRTTTAVQGVFYVALSWVPTSYALGRHSSGSNRSQHHTTGDLLRLPAGREIVFVLGLVVIGLCANQVRTALTAEYAEGLDLSSAPRWVCWLVHRAAVVGIPARALVFVPVGALLLVTAVHSDAGNADGLDQILARLVGHPWGVSLLVVVALGLLVFSTYTFLEARYRKVHRAQ